MLESCSFGISDLDFRIGGLSSTSPYLLFIQRGFPFRPRLPPPMNPQPLIRIAADDVLGNPVKGPRVLHNVAGGIPCCNQLDGGVEMKAVLPCVAIPDEESGNHGRARSQRKGCNGRSRGRRYPEEVHEHSLVTSRVLVHKNADSLVIPQRPQNVPGRISLVDRRVARKASIGFDKPFHFVVVYLSHDKLHRISVKRVSKTAQFPGSEVRSEENDTLSPCNGVLVMLESVVIHQFCDVVLV